MKWHQARRQQEKWSHFKGGITLSGSLFLALSFLSYSPQDPSFNSFGLSLKVSNYCGYVGAFLSDFFFQIFGLASWLFVPAGILLSFTFFQKTSQARIFQKVSLFFLFLTSLSCLLNLYFPKTTFYEDTVSFGGAFAVIILKGLMPFFHTMGVGLVLWSVVILSFLLYGQASFFQFLSFLQKLLLKAGSLFLLVLRTSGSFLSHQTKTLLEKDWNFLFKKIEQFVLKIKKPTKQKPQLVKTPPIEKTNSTDKKKIEFSFPYQNNPAGLKEEKPLPTGRSEETKEKVPISLYTEEKTQTAKHKTKPFTLKDRPALDLLAEPPQVSQKMSREEVEILAKKLTDKLGQFSIHGKITAIKAGPAVIMFEFKPQEDVKVSRIKEMATDLSLALSSESVRIIAPIPGRDVVGIEASSPYREKVYLKNMLKEESFLQASLPLVLGRRSDNAICIRDLAKIPHLLIAGTTGSGKSVFVISFITSLLFRHTPNTLRLLLVDPKQVDLSAFNEVPHLLSPIITSASQVIKSLNWAIAEMEKRYRSLSYFGVRDIGSFNKLVEKMSAKEKKEHQIKNESCLPLQSYYFESLPFICIAIEEFGDLMVDMQYRKGIEHSVVRLAQKARASGIHLVLAMQSPRKDVVTGLIKTNIPGRISFKVASGTDSRVILDEVGAERLLSHGDMLFLEPGTSKPLRYHGPFVSEKEVSRVVAHWKAQSLVEYEEVFKAKSKESSLQDLTSFGDVEADTMYEEILHFVQSCESVSASLLQRKFRIGYPRAARLIEVLFDEGVVGPSKGSKPREVLIK